MAIVRNCKATEHLQHLYTSCNNQQVFLKSRIEHTANVQSISTTYILSQRDGETHNTLSTLINSTCIALRHQVNVCLKKGGRKKHRRQ